MIRSLLVIAAVLAFAACVSVKPTMVGTPAARTFTIEEVALYLADDAIPEDCRRVAVLDATADTDFTDRSGMYEKFREESGALGANAVQIRAVDEAITSVWDGYASGTRSGTAVAYACGGHQ